MDYEADDRHAPEGSTSTESLGMGVLGGQAVGDQAITPGTGYVETEAWAQSCLADAIYTGDEASHDARGSTPASQFGCGGTPQGHGGHGLQRHGGHGLLRPRKADIASHGHGHPTPTTAGLTWGVAEGGACLAIGPQSSRQTYVPPQPACRTSRPSDQPVRGPAMLAVGEASGTDLLGPQRCAQARTGGGGSFAEARAGGGTHDNHHPSSFAEARTGGGAYGNPSYARSCSVRSLGGRMGEEAYSQPGDEACNWPPATRSREEVYARSPGGPGVYARSPDDEVHARSPGRRKGEEAMGYSPGSRDEVYARSPGGRKDEETLPEAPSLNLPHSHAPRRSVMGGLMSGGAMEAAHGASPMVGDPLSPPMHAKTGVRDVRTLARPSPYMPAEEFSPGMEGYSITSPSLSINLSSPSTSSTVSCSWTRKDAAPISSATSNEASPLLSSPPQPATLSAATEAEASPLTGPLRKWGPAFAPPSSAGLLSISRLSSAGLFPLSVPARFLPFSCPP